MLTNEQKKSLTAIAELIEDEHFPALRVIADYAIQLLPLELNKEATNYMESEYQRFDSTPLATEERKV